MAKILVVDDDEEMRKAIKDLLTSERHSVDCAASAMEGWDFIKAYPYDLLMLDWEMPGMSGVELLEKYRRQGGKTPVVMLTARKEIADKITGLDVGADNYVTKPFDRDFFLSLIRATLRRQVEEVRPTIRRGDLELSEHSSQVICADQAATLTGQEFQVLKLLLQNSGHLISHDEIRAACWPGEDPSSATVRVFLSKMREKLGALGSEIQILNVRGYGYQVSFKKK